MEFMINSQTVKFIIILQPSKVLYYYGILTQHQNTEFLSTIVNQCVCIYSIFIIL